MKLTKMRPSAWFLVAFLISTISASEAFSAGQDEGGPIDLRENYAVCDAVTMAYYADISHNEIYSTVVITQPEEINRIISTLHGTKSFCPKCLPDALITLSLNNEKLGEIECYLYCNQLSYNGGCIRITEESVDILSTYKTLISK